MHILFMYERTRSFFADRPRVAILLSTNIKHFELLDKSVVPKVNFGHSTSQNDAYGHPPSIYRECLLQTPA